MMAERSAGAEPARGFEAAADDSGWSYEGPLTFGEAGRVLTAAHALPLPRNGRVDLDRLGAFDSAAVAVLVALARRAEREGRALRFEGLPGGLRALATLYGVEEILAG
jgi:phospholipid transport system transporter-binding protein